MSTAFQDTYPDDVAHCYGCGTQNPAGHQLKSHWDGEETVARFTPRPEHTAMPGYVYGGLIASLVDCHGTGSAGSVPISRPCARCPAAAALRYVTASLHVDYLAPTPMGVELELRGVLEEVTERKVVVAETVHAGETLVAKGKVVAVLMPAGMDQG